MAEAVRTVVAGICVLVVVGVVVGAVRDAARRLAAHEKAMRARREAGRRRPTHLPRP